MQATASQTDVEAGEEGGSRDELRSPAISSSQSGVSLCGEEAEQQDYLDQEEEENHSIGRASAAISPEPSFQDEEQEVSFCTASAAVSPEPSFQAEREEDDIVDQEGRDTYMGRFCAAVSPAPDMVLGEDEGLPDPEMMMEEEEEDDDVQFVSEKGPGIQSHVLLFCPTAFLACLQICGIPACVVLLQHSDLTC